MTIRDAWSPTLFQVEGLPIWVSPAFFIRQSKNLVVKRTLNVRLTHATRTAGKTGDQDKGSAGQGSPALFQVEGLSIWVFPAFHQPEWEFFDKITCALCRTVLAVCAVCM